MGETARGYGTVAGGAHNLVEPLQTPGYGRGTVAGAPHNPMAPLCKPLVSRFYQS